MPISTTLAHLTLPPCAQHYKQSRQPAPWACKATKCVLKPKRLVVPKGLLLTRIAHGGVQEVHGGPRQAQPIHAIWGLFEVRHHANSRVEAPRRIQGAWRSAGLPPLSPSSSVSYVDSAYGDKRHKETIIRNHLGFLVLSEARSLGMGRGHRLQSAQGSQLGSTRP